MKKFLLMMMCVILACGMLAGCGSKESDEAPAEEPAAEESAEASDEITEDEAKEAVTAYITDSMGDLFTDLTIDEIRLYTDEEQSEEPLSSLIKEGQRAFEVTYTVTPKDDDAKFDLTAGAAEENEDGTITKFNLGTLERTDDGSLKVDNFGTGW